MVRGWLKGGYFGTRLSLSVIVSVYIVCLFACLPACLFACLLLAFDSALLFCAFLLFLSFYK